MAKSPEAARVDAYLDAVSRIEPEIAMLDTGAALASIAISLKRIADALTRASGNNIADNIDIITLKLWEM